MQDLASKGLPWSPVQAHRAPLPPALPAPSTNLPPASTASAAHSRGSSEGGVHCRQGWVQGAAEARGWRGLEPRTALIDSGRAQRP